MIFGVERRVSPDAEADESGAAGSSQTTPMTKPLGPASTRDGGAAQAGVAFAGIGLREHVNQFAVAHAGLVEPAVDRRG